MSTFSVHLATCDGTTSSTITQNRQCSIPIAALRIYPFNLPWGASVFAKVSAINAYGTSLESALGNGATILTVPDAPINLVEVASLTKGTQVGLSWSEGEMNGGADVIDYRVWSD